MTACVQWSSLQRATHGCAPFGVVVRCFGCGGGGGGWGPWGYVCAGRFSLLSRVKVSTDSLYLAFWCFCLVLVAQLVWFVAAYMWLAVASKSLLGMGLPFVTSTLGSESCRLLAFIVALPGEQIEPLGWYCSRAPCLVSRGGRCCS